MIEATDATVGTSLKNQSLRSSLEPLENLEKNYETRKTIKNVKNLYRFLIFYNSLVDLYSVRNLELKASEILFYSYSLLGIT